MTGRIEELCANRCYFKRIKNFAGQSTREGLCRIYPPSGNPAGVWPATGENEWCGGYKAKKSDSPPAKGFF